MRYAAAAAFVSRLRVSHNWGMSGVLHFYWVLFDYYFPSVKFRFVFFIRADMRIMRFGVNFGSLI
jgi:hypothetical protein